MKHLYGLRRYAQAMNYSLSITWTWYTHGGEPGEYSVRSIMEQTFGLKDIVINISANNHGDIRHKREVPIPDQILQIKAGIAVRPII